MPYILTYPVALLYLGFAGFTINKLQRDLETTKHFGRYDRLLD
jgi:hypothetical protein